MGKIRQGILGGFNGTVGTVVGGSWKGMAYMRGKAQSVKNPRTEKQMAQRINKGNIFSLRNLNAPISGMGCTIVRCMDYFKAFISGGKLFTDLP